MDITEENNFHVTSNIMVLDGIRKIDGIFTPNSLPWEYGFIVDAEKMGFAGKIEGAFGFDKTDMRHPKKLQNAKLVFCDELIQLLERATIECNDAFKVIKRYDTPATFHFIDPPYVGSYMGHYSGMFNDQNLKELLELCETLQGKFMLTMYPNDEI